MRRLFSLLRRKLTEICLDYVHGLAITESSFVTNVTEVVLAFGDESFIEAARRWASLEWIDIRVSEYRQDHTYHLLTAEPVTRGPEPSPLLEVSLAAGAEEAAAAGEELLTGSASEDALPEIVTRVEAARAEDTAIDPAGAEESGAATAEVDDEDEVSEMVM